ncbi:hypothetical protein A6770_37045 [Nostoc minutum NIES-26]|uniref:Uncharacterized protein n=1 Tax=Nostoc minutum NIES-26 TaxID=1844469 RepID=A0A367RYK9_9NOSO|nr:hypothetical protein A6770_37045 [Nostoc minutum NIES-26]
MKIKIKKIIAITIVTSIVSSTFLVAPSYGLQLDKDFQKIIALITKIGEAWGEQGQKVEDSTKDSVGEMNQPDPIAASEYFKDKTDAESLPTAQEKGEALQRAIARLKVSQALGKEGQQETKALVQQNSQVAQQAQDLADEAQNMDASQNILKVIAAQNSQIVGMLANQRTDSLQRQYDTVHSNILLTQVAQQMANEREGEKLGRTGVISLNHELIGMSRLDPTYQQQ